ncbi:MAG: 3-dehydroquinate synthase [Planctomycetia bacterium]|nr:3-dehydroquinate synthase [Planctomycetia bacterium]
MRVHLSADSGQDDRSYDIVVGAGTLGGIGAAVMAAGGRRSVVIADAGVAGSHATAAVASLTAAGVTTAAVTVPAGEASKSIGGLERLWNELARLAVDRRTHVVAVGGGVVGDLAGFTAATFGRGLPVWHVPTTLVAQVDSAIGGKTGINLAAGKNLVGSFWQPRGVFADVDTLSALPDREFISGLAEVVKYGMILDPEFFAWLEANAAAVLARRPEALAHVVGRSAALKAHVVERDEREVSGLRAILNYGHTFAHAYETAAGYGRLLHGEAVAVGMEAAAALATAIGKATPDIGTRQRRLLEALALPVVLPADCRCPAERWLDIMARDKKTVAGRLRFVLPTRIGHVEVVEGIDQQAVRAVLDR